MFCIVLVSMYVLTQSTIPVAGQCTVFNCAVSDSGPEESLLKRLEEHDHKMRSAFDKKFQTMNETLSSAIDQIYEKLTYLLNQVNEKFQCARTQSKRMNHVFNEVNPSIYEISRRIKQYFK